MINKSMKLQIKLWHVNIHVQWLRQKVQQQTIQIKWVSTKNMIANNFIKALTMAKYKAFIDLIGVKNQTSLLAAIKQKNDNQSELIVGPKYSAAFG